MQTTQQSQFIRAIRAACAALIVLACSSLGLGQAPRSRVIAPAVRAVEAAPLQDDATLHAVTFVGARFGCAVGDRGVCWTTRDGGASWSFSPTPVQCALHGVHFLTDRIGWAVGGEVAPYTRFASGVVIHTTDGGQTWQVLSQHTLPPLTQVRFLDQELGLAIGETTSTCATGMLATIDGGVTWTPTEGPRAAGWRTAAILPNGAGVVAGARGELGILGRGQLVKTVATLRGLRGFNSASLGGDSTGWLVGDGGWVLTTKNNGVSWAPPEGNLPSALRECMDFQAVAQVGEKVWIAGAPGSVIWHSADAGAHWTTQSTGEKTPLRSLHFTDEQHGVAVGDLGKILVTDDGGATWTAVRGGERRLALLMIHAHPQQLSLSLTAYFSGEWGYRSGVVLLTRRDLGSDALRNLPVQLRVEEAFSTVGGSSATLDWRLPITVPSLDRDRDKLLEEWLLLTDQKLPQVVTTDLVAKIRMWQPEVVLISTPAETDAAARITWDAVQEAVAAAASRSAYAELETLVGLPPWQVQKIFANTPGVSGAQNVAAQDYLARAGMTIDQLAEPAAARLFESREVAIRNEGLTLVYSDMPNQTVASQSLFGGLNIPTGGPARRILSTASLDDLEDRKHAIQRRASFWGYAARQMDGRSQGAELIAHLMNEAKELPPDQGAKLLSDMARGYRERMLWDSAEQTSLLLLDLYPDHPAANESATWLLRFWTSSEMSWQRLRPRISKQTEFQINPAIQQANFESQLEKSQRRPGTLSAPGVEVTAPKFEGTDTPVRVKPKGLGAILQDDTSGADIVTMQSEQWRTQATKISGLVEKTSPGFFSEPEVQSALAALMRRGSRHSDADRIVDKLLKLDSQSSWNKIAQGEAWLLRPQALSPRPILVCRKTGLPPRLDGQLNDACWVGAAEVLLSDQPPENGDAGFVGTQELNRKGGLQIVGPRALVMLLHDDRFLYLAGSLPRMDRQSKDAPQMGGRTHDADLALHDRLSFQFDTDRDYNTFYRFDVDQRGWTSEACWDAAGWNPKWFVAAYGDDQVWRFEAAIPWEELVPTPPTPGTFWATGVTRVIPNVGLQGWNHPLTETPAPQTFGLLKFE